MKLEYLPWDSEFFDLRVGRISIKNGFPIELLTSEIEKAREEGYELLYVFLSKNQNLTNQFLTDNNGKLVDKKVIYELTISKVQSNKHIEVEDYKEVELHSELLNLAYLSGRCSRFLLDEKITENLFKKLYKEWIIKSLSGKLADKVFVAKDKNQIIGFVTLKIKNGVGEIGLIAVSEKAQGKKVGTKLMDACVHYLHENSIETLIVSTQIINNHACGFYENYGFTVKSITTVYHFWMNIQSV